MYTLYGSPGAASLAVHWLLIELGAAHEYVVVDTAAKQQKEGWYLKLNPNGVVPHCSSMGSHVTSARRCCSC